ncbi:MAG TPA: hypothetical protein VG944_22495 [Fimbriimonas sp.]|nr:hypothetical protein [Fimbriimonas sp.]
MPSTFRKSCLAVLVVALSGCGGGGGSSDSGGQLQSSTLGEATFSYRGKLKPALSASTDAVTVAGVGGAAFSNVDFYPAKTSAESPIVYARNGQVWIWSNGTQKMISAGFYLTNYCSWTTNGKILFDGDDQNGFSNIYTMNADGSNVTLLKTQARSASMSPDGKHIVYCNKSLHLIQIDPNGSNLVDLAPSLTVSSTGVPSWTSDSKTIYFSAASGGPSHLFRVNSAGGNPVDVTPSQVAGSDCFAPSVSPNGRLLAFHTFASDFEVHVYDLQEHIIRTVTPNGSNDTCPYFAPDGHSLIFERRTGTDTSVVSSIVDGTSNTILFGDPPSVPTTYAAYQPAPGFQRFVGSGGPLGSTCSGFLFGQYGDSFASIAAFSATTPSSVQIQQANPGTSSGAPLAFMVTGDSINRVVYANGYYATPVSISPVGDTTVFISFSANTGLVTSLAPLAVSGSRALSRSNTTTTTVTYEGPFKTVYDGKGKNLAPNGARSLTIDRKTGALVGIH